MFGCEVFVETGTYLGDTTLRMAEHFEQCFTIELDAKLAERARKLAESHELRLACHLIELASLAEPENKAVHSVRAEIYQQRRQSESSLMAKGIFGYASAESLDAAGEEDPFKN